MNKEELTPWIERLNAEADKEKRKEIVAELCKATGLKNPDAWALLKEAGFDPKIFDQKAKPAGDTPAASAQSSGGAAPAAPPSADSNAGGKRAVLASHKTEYDKYRCAGLMLSKKPENYAVTAEQYEKLARDPWVTVTK